MGRCKRENQYRQAWYFGTAALVFQDENRIEFYDEAHSTDEDRYITIGQINGIAVTVVIMVVYTERERAIRLISARKATTQEGRMYYDYTQGN